MLVYDNSDHEDYYCPELVKLFYANIDQASIDLDTHQFTVHLATGDIIVTVDMLEDCTQVPINPHYSDPLPLIEYMTMMGARCIEQDRGSKSIPLFLTYIALDTGSNTTSLALTTLPLLIG